MSRRERLRRKRQRQSGARPLFVALGAVTTVLVIAIVGIVGYVMAVAASAPSLDSLTPKVQGQDSIVYAADGTRLGLIQSPILRSPVTFRTIPQIMKDATVAIEDRRFYEHKGVDYEGIIRAALKNLESHDTVQGGSTLTMQLIKNLYPRANGKRDYKVKIREAKLAQELEDRHPGAAGKRWVLAKYLNSVPYGTAGGQEAVGVQAAARIFFDKSVSRLTLAEAALLAGLPQATTDYNPHLHPVPALRRRNEVLRQMARQRLITAQEADAAVRAPLGVTSSSYYTKRREGYFFDYVIGELTARYRSERVQRGGLHIYTTLDLKRQRAARAAMAKGIAGTNRDAAVVTVEPDTGYLRAMATSREYGDLKFNLASQGRRQAGSTFKVMVLMAALRRGVNPATTTYTSMPLNFTDPRWGPIRVKTYSNRYIGRANLVRATLTSDNSIYQQLDLDIGPTAVKNTAIDMGIASPLHGYPSEALGSASVSPLEMARAYATIANGGSRIRPTSVTKVVFPDGRTQVPYPPTKKRMFTDGVAAEATKILEANVKGGTGVAADIGCPAAGKTGTTDDFTDAWFVGYTPRLSTSVWVGHASSREPMPGASGGAAAAPIWGAYMKVARAGYCGGFPKPKEPFAARAVTLNYSRYGVRGGLVAAAPTGGYDPGGYEAGAPRQSTPPAASPPAAPPQTTPSSPAPAAATPVPRPDPGGAPTP